MLDQGLFDFLLINGFRSASIRNLRRKYIDTVKDLEKDKSISIDESKKNQDEVQKSTDNSISEIDDLVKQKENEILKV